MRETTPAAMPPCFDRWCQKFDDLFKTKAQKTGFRHYLGGLLGESKRKNITQIADNTYGVKYNRLHHFLTDAPWDDEQINERRLFVMNKCSQTKINRGFSLILDDSGHRKSGNFTDGVGRQYIGKIGKTEQGIVVVTTHLYDGKKSLPLDIELYQPASSLPEGKEDIEFQKKPEIGLKLIEKSLKRGYRPGIVLIDGGYGNNTSFLKELEAEKLKYLGRTAKNRKVIYTDSSGDSEEIRLDEIAKNAGEELEEIELNLNKPKKVWVKTFTAEISSLEGKRNFAIVMKLLSMRQQILIISSRILMHLR